MPNKPDLEYAKLDIPESYTKVVKAFADICLEFDDTKLPLSKVKEDYNNFIDFTACNNSLLYNHLSKVNSDFRNINDNFNILGFTFEYDDHGKFNVTFNLKELVTSKYSDLFNPEFYGKITGKTLLSFFNWIMKNPELVNDSCQWLKYRYRLKERK